MKLLESQLSAGSHPLPITIKSEPVCYYSYTI